MPTKNTSLNDYLLAQDADLASLAHATRLALRWMFPSATLVEYIADEVSVTRTFIQSGDKYANRLSECEAARKTSGAAKLPAGITLYYEIKLGSEDRVVWFDLQTSRVGCSPDLADVEKQIYGGIATYLIPKKPETKKSKRK